MSDNSSTNNLGYNIKDSNGAILYGPYAFGQKGLKYLNSQKQSATLEGIDEIQMIGKKIEFLNDWSIKSIYPDSYSTIHYTNSIFSLTRVPLNITGFRNCSDYLNCAFISPNQFYSKEVVLTLGLYEAALRSNYNKHITEKLPNINLLAREKLHFKNLYFNLTKIDILKQTLVKFQDKDLHNIDHLKTIVDEFSIGIKFYFFDSNNNIKNYFQVPEDPKINPIPIIKLIEYQGCYSILYTDVENTNDGFDETGNSTNQYSADEINDSFYFTSFQGFKEILLGDLLDVLTWLNRNDQQSKSKARKKYQDLSNSIESERKIASSGINESDKVLYDNLKLKFDNASWILDASPNKNIKTEINKNGPQVIQSYPIDPKGQVSITKPPYQNQDLSKASVIPKNNPTEIQSEPPKSVQYSNIAGFPNNIPNTRPPSGNNQNANRSPNIPQNSQSYNVDHPNPPTGFNEPRSQPPINYPPQLIGNLPSQNRPQDRDLMFPPSTAPKTNIPITEGFNFGPSGTSALQSGNYQNYDAYPKTVQNHTLRATVKKEKKCPGCDRDKVLSSFHDACFLCQTCLATSVIDKRCINCNKNTQAVLNGVRSLRDNGFKCNACGNRQKDVRVSDECGCIVCGNCISKLKMHNYHQYV
jgi:hypothetical protein